MGAVLCCMRQPSPGYDYQLKMNSSSSRNRFVSPSQTETPFTDDDDDDEEQNPAKYAKTTEKIHDLETEEEEKKYRMIGRMTLEDCLLASPNANSNPNHPRNHVGIEAEIQISKHFPRKLCADSASPSPRQIEGKHEFFTPRMNLSPVDKLGVIEEEIYEYGGEVRNLSTKLIMNRNGSGKLGKKVRFRMPEEADIYLYYTPKETFEDE